jgi:hypothetical protein
LYQPIWNSEWFIYSEILIVLGMYEREGTLDNVLNFIWHAHADAGLIVMI